MAETKMQLADWLDDLCVRFIINLPKEELESVERICFQVEEAQWFYEDFIRPLDPSLPSMNLRQFCLLIFQYCPFLSDFSESHHMAAYSQFLAYKTRVPVRGAIMLNDAMDHVLLVKGWKKAANWSFPRGKINKDEKDLDCAIREVYEETGFDLTAAGLAQDESQMKFIEVTMREQHMKLYVFRGVPTDTMFQPRTRKEISKIQWYKLASLPGYQKKKQHKLENGEDALSANKLYMVAPFLVPLKKWIAQQHKQDRQGDQHASYNAYVSGAEGNATDIDYVPAEEATLNAGDGDLAPQSYDPHSDSFDLTKDSQSFAIPQAPSGDQAAALKRMLSINESQPGLQPSAEPEMQAEKPHDNSSSLLAILKGPRPPVHPSIGMSDVPQTPLEHIENGSRQPPSPRHHQSRPPLPSSMPPPPKFPLPPNQFYQQPLPALAQPQPPTTLHRDSLQAPLGPQFINQEPTAHKPGRPIYPFASHVPQLHSNGIAAPYRRVGDPNFTIGNGQSVSNFPVGPSASHLPAPKLNSHTLKLLNTFKGTDKKPVTAEHTAPVQQKSHENAGRGKDVTPPVSRKASNQQEQISRRSSSRAAFGGLIPSVLSPTMVGGNAKYPAPPELQRKTTAHQESLLKMFKSPSEVTPAPQPKPQKPEITEQPKTTAHQDALLKLFKAPTPMAPTPTHKPEPVKGVSPAPTPGPIELAAAATPALKSENKQLGEAKASPLPDQKRPVVPKILARPPGAPPMKSPAITSATVSGPLKAPEFDAISRHDKRSKEGNAGAGKSSTEKLGQAKIHASQETLTKTVNEGDSFASNKSTGKSSKEANKLANQWSPTKSAVESNAFAKREFTKRARKDHNVSSSHASASKLSPTFHILQRPKDKQVQDALPSRTNTPSHPPRAMKGPDHENKQLGQPGMLLSSRKQDDRNRRPATPSKAAEPNGISSKPFQPQILRRPQQCPKTLAATSVQQHSDHQAITSEERRKALLSLFGPADQQKRQKEIQATPLATPSGSKGSPFRFPTLPGGDDVITPTALTRSRVDSATSPALEQIKSRMNSFSSAPRGDLAGAGRRDSGGQTPLSPSDRGYLQSYLEGAIKKGARP